VELLFAHLPLSPTFFKTSRDYHTERENNILSLPFQLVQCERTEHLEEGSLNLISSF
jgi:hypothetical protein